MTPEEHIKKLMEQNAEFKIWFQNNLPHIVGIEAVNFFHESFQNEGFTDEVLEKWQEVKRRQNPKRPERASASRPILTGETGDLGRSIEYKIKDGDTVITADTVESGSEKDYASAHNEGTTNAGRNHNVVIPKRQFIGKSKKLDKIIVDKSTENLKRIIR
jgi:phage gpG-like protein